MMRPFCVLVVLLLAASRASAQAPEIPVAPDVTFVLAVGNQTPSQGAPGGILQGDYEFVVRIVQAGAGGLTQTASFDGRDAAGVQRRGTVTRVVSAADLANARAGAGLSVRRSPCVRRYDGARAAARLLTVGRGERQPIETNDTLAGRARNRRVELVCAER